MNMETKKIIEKTDQTILELKENMQTNAYQCIEDDILLARNQIQNYTGLDDSEQIVNKVGESLNHCLEKMICFGPSLGNTYVVESDLYNAIITERDMFLDTQSKTDLIVRVDQLTTQLGYFAEHIQENRKVGNDLSLNCEIV